MGKSRKATAAAVVALALLLQLLAPIPVSRGEVTPICTAAGLILLLGPDGAPQPDHAAGDHCPLCLLPRIDGVAAAGGGLVAVRAVRADVIAVPAPPAFALRLRGFSPHAQRAPPAA